MTTIDNNLYYVIRSYAFFHRTSKRFACFAPGLDETAAVDKTKKRQACSILRDREQDQENISLISQDTEKNLLIFTYQRRDFMVYKPNEIRS